ADPERVPDNRHDAPAERVGDFETGIGHRRQSIKCRLPIADCRFTEWRLPIGDWDCRLAPADDADDEEDDDGADGEADAETVAAARRQHALAGGAEIE